MAQQTALSRYVRVQRGVDRELARDLKDAADEAERMILALGKRKDVGSVIRRSQLAGTLKQLRKLQAELWGSVSKATEMGMMRAAEAAAEGEIAVNRVLFNAAGVVMVDFDEAMRLQAQEGIANLLARGANDIRLSSQVYKSAALSKKLVDKAINRALLLGFSAKELAATVKGLINPNTPGGVSYAAKRLARTEINNAFHTSQVNLRQDDPWTNGFKWHLSGSHPRPDECNDYASRTHYRGGEPGVFKVGNVPGKPHPQCLCWLETVVMDKEDFIDAMASGRFDSFIESKIDTYGI